VTPQNGLSTAEAQSRLQKYGLNVLAGKKKESGLRAFLRQYRDFMQIILVVAALLSLVFTAELGYHFGIAGLDRFQRCVGLKQESKAEASLAALQKMMKNIVRVRRDGQVLRSKQRT